MGQNRKGLGYGLWSCRNCTAFKHRSADDEETCEEYGILDSHAPCGIDRSWFGGEFDPIELGNRLTVAKPFSEVVDHLDRDEAMLVKYLVECRLWDLLHRPRSDLKIGQRVVVQVGSHIHRGVITKLATDKVHIRSDHAGIPLAVTPGVVQLETNEVSS